MSVTDCREHHKGRTGEWTADKRTYQAAWILGTDAAEDGPAVVVEYVARYRAPLKSGYRFGADRDSSAKCVKLRPQLLAEDRNRKTWLVTATYETEADKGGGGEKGGGGGGGGFRDENGKITEDPLQQHDRVDVSEAKFTRPCHKATYRSGLVGIQAGRRAEGTECAPANSAFVAFSPVPERDDSREVIRITKSLPDWPDAVAAACRDTVNSLAIFVRKQFCKYTANWAAQTIKVDSVTGSFQYANNVQYWDVTVQFVRDGRGWREEYLDRGVHAAFGGGLPDENGEIVSMTDPRIREGLPPTRRLLDHQGNPITEEVRLDGNGQPLGIDQPDVFLVYSKYPERDFQELFALKFFL